MTARATGDSGGAADGSWEAAVAQVTVAGRPTIVYDLAKRWQAMSGRTAESLRYLEKLRGLLFDGADGWRGPAATEYQQVLDEIGRRIQGIEDDSHQLAVNLDRTGQSLAEAVGHIPVPINIGSDVLCFGNTHELPGGTDLDGDNAMHDPNAFVNSIAADYSANPGKYRDFRAFLAQSGDYGTAAGDGYDRARDEPTAGSAAGRRKQLIDAWYEENATVATHWFTALRIEYTEQWSGLPRDDAGSTGGTGGGTSSEVPSSAGTSSGASPAVSSPSDPAGAVPSAGATRLPATGGAASPSGGTGLAGGSAVTAAPAPTATAGLVRAGTGDAGPSLAATSPLTSPGRALLDGNASTAGTGAGVGAIGAGATIYGAGHREEHQTWLTDDDATWHVHPGPPSLIE